MCGAAALADAKAAIDTGLSPRVRGSPGSYRSPHLRVRSIPTCAGQPARDCFRLCRRTVYPHVCGAAIRTETHNICEAGLSPRVRGSHVGGMRVSAEDGSIPTCAGQPLVAAVIITQARVYPHVCGAAIDHTFYLYPFYGLSPRVRGSLNNILNNDIGYRSIPTCAGQPRAGTTHFHQHRVYPHVCGAACAFGFYVGFHLGLSPRVRGSHSPVVSHGATARSIPTCAGQPALRLRSHIEYRVYPHVCGAAQCALHRRIQSRGLSPRVRGSLSLVGNGILALRSIPTCAGQPLSPD